MQNPLFDARRAFLIAFALGLCAVIAPAAGQTAAWRPDKAVELIAASAPGGSNDKSARVVQKILQYGKIVPVPVNVVHKTGGNQSLSRATSTPIPAMRITSTWRTRRFFRITSRV